MIVVIVIRRRRAVAGVVAARIFVTVDGSSVSISWLRVVLVAVLHFFVEMVLP